MTTFSQWLKWATNQLIRVENPRIEAEMLLMHAMQISKAQCITQPERILPKREEEKLNLLLERRKRGEPMAYIIGQKPFWNFTLKVTPDVLIPRPETEVLVEQVLADYTKPNLTVLDLGTGSGAIAIALALERPWWKITAVDCSVAALNVAKENAQQFKANHVEFIQSDWFSNLDGRKFDIIVSNPPYIAEQDSEWHPESKLYEPKAALVGGGKDGLEQVKLIIESSKRHLHTKGSLFLEHGHQQGQLTQEIFRNNGYDFIHTFRDLSGKERVTIGVT